jgi:hypothetical protein
MTACSDGQAGISVHANETVARDEEQQDDVDQRSLLLRAKSGTQRWHERADAHDWAGGSATLDQVTPSVRRSLPDPRVVR